MKISFSRSFLAKDLDGNFVTVPNNNSLTASVCFNPNGTVDQIVAVIGATTVIVKPEVLQSVNCSFFIS